MSNVLINVSNHQSDRWSDEQRAGWDEIVDIPFQNIPAMATTEDVKEIARILGEKIYGYKISYRQLISVSMQGEYSLCYFVNRILMNGSANVSMVFPCSERITVERPDGTKESKFEFKQWRKM